MVATLWVRMDRRWIGLLFLVCVAIGCAAPTLPLPPPAALVEAPPDASGLVTVNGNARPGTFVGCLNENSERGILLRADVDTGDFSFQIGAEVADTLRLWQFDATDSGGMPDFITVPGP